MNNPDALRAWASWLKVDEEKLRRLVAMVGPFAGQIEYILGMNPRSRW